MTSRYYGRLGITLIFLLGFQGCCHYRQCEDQPIALACLNLIDREGSATTIQADERLKKYENVDFLRPQPYEKVLRVYKRDSCGNAYSYITTYYPNGQLMQYMEVLNGGASGAYREWHENGGRKLECTVVGGTPDITPEAQKTWQMDGICSAWDDCGNLVATYVYCRGSLEGESFQYYPDGTIKLRTPYLRNEIHGNQELFFADGKPMASAEWVNGRLSGRALRFWACGQQASEENYEDTQLIDALYYNTDGELVGTIVNGEGYRAIFDKERLKELQQYRNGVQDGEVRLFNEKGHLTSIYAIKEGLKHGEETVFYAPGIGMSKTDPKLLNPQLVINWYEGKVHGITKTWYPDGTIQSQREMSNNHREGIASAWYQDGSIMLMEQYEKDKLIRGEYYKRGDFRPESRVIDGDGIAVLYDANGHLLRRVTYYHGFVVD